jgi:hypothetical protein
VFIYRSTDDVKAHCTLVDVAQRFGDGSHIGLKDKVLCALPAL